MDVHRELGIWVILLGLSRFVLSFASHPALATHCNESCHDHNRVHILETRLDWTRELDHRVYQSGVAFAILEWHAVYHCIFFRSFSSLSQSNSGNLYNIYRLLFVYKQTSVQYTITSMRSGATMVMDDFFSWWCHHRQR